MAMSGFICHDDYLQKTAKLTDEEVGRLIRALMRYHATGVADEVDGRESIAFDFIREDIDRTEAAYKAKCEKNRNNRLSALNNDRQQSSTTVNDRVQKEKEKEKEKEKDKDKYNNNKKEENNYFDRFWSAYPRHVNKPGAMKAFEKAKIDGDLLDVILKAIERQKASDQWTKDNGQFIPHPATWLNQKRWEDELPTTHQKPKVVQDFPQRDYSGVQDELMADLAREMEEFNARETG